MVIDELIVIENGEQKIVDSADNTTIDVINYNNVDYHFAKENEVTDGVCENAVNEPIIDMQISGNSVQESENLFDKTKMVTGFLPTSGAYPTTNSSYPNTSYQIIDVEAGQTVEITYYSSTEDIYGRIRYIDNETNQVVGSVTRASNDYYNSTETYNNGFKNGQITAKKDFKLGIMYLANLPTDFKLEVVSIAPTPEIPIEIESVGDKTKNLFDNEWIIGIYSTTDGTYAPSSNRICTKNFVKVKPNTTYTISFTTTININSVMRIIFYDSDGTFIGSISNKGTFITPENCSNMRFYLATNYTVETAPIGQIEEGTVATEYEPYGYKIPVKAGGKNLFRTENITYPYTISGITVSYDANTQIYTFNGTSTASADFYTIPSTTEILNIKQNETYCMRVYNVGGTTTGEPVNLRAGINNKNWTSSILCGIDIPITKTFSQDTIITRMYFYLYGTGIVYDNYQLKVQLEKSDTPTEFEPYIEPATTNIYLSEPLRKIGDYADYIDYKNKKVVRKIYRYELNGDDKYVQYGGWTKIDIVTEGLNTYGNVINNLNIGSSLNDMGKIMCSDYPITRVNGLLATTTTPVVCLHYSRWQNLMFKVDAEKYPDIETWKNYLAERYNAGNPIVVDGILKDEYVTEETIELPTIETFDGTNIFDIETTIEPSQVKINYWKQI